MNTHHGPVVLLADGLELTATAALAKNGSGTWGGSLTFPAAAKRPELLNLREGQLQIDHRLGAFVRPDASDWLDSPAGQLRIRIQGNGDAPF
jgi:hypothetical protein